MAKSSSFRINRIRKQLIRELSDIVARELGDTRLAGQMVSVIDADISPDFGHVKAYVSVFGDDAQKASVLEALTEQTPRARQLLGQRIRLRVTPTLVFKLDDSLERGSRVSSLLEKIARGEA